MNPGRMESAARAAGAVAVIVAACLGFTGCGKRVTKVDVGYKTPEGVLSSNARLLMWYATTTTMDIYLDDVPLGPSLNDVQNGSQTFFTDPVGSIHGMLFDQTPAESFEMLRREPGGGLRAFEDFAITPTRKWIASNWEIYRFHDFTPSSYQPPSYTGRGLLGGHVSALSPVTNEAMLASSSLGNINVTVTPTSPTDTSVTSVHWDIVPGAVNYLIQIYEFTQASVGQQLASGLPTPIFDGQSLDHFVLWFRWGPGSVPDYQLGDTTRTDLDIVFQRRLLRQPDPSVLSPLIRVSAFDASGQMIAYSRSPAANPPGSNPVFPRNYGVFPVSDTEYGIFPLGALQVERIRFPRPR